MNELKVLEFWFRLENFLKNYFENSFTIVSNTKTGPVLPKIVSGWPANKLYKIPQTAPDKRLSIADLNLKK